MLCPEKDRQFICYLTPVHCLFFLTVTHYYCLITSVINMSFKVHSLVYVAVISCYTGTIHRKKCSNCQARFIPKTSMRFTEYLTLPNILSLELPINILEMVVLPQLPNVQTVSLLKMCKRIFCSAYLLNATPPPLFPLHDIGHITH